jgi:HPt (histidine-containing phosphotransfer) domain-containing protein
MMVPTIPDAAMYERSLKAKADTVRRLCAALQDYLLSDIELALEQVARMPDQQRHYSAETLVAAQADVERIEQQIEQMRAAMADMQPDNPMLVVFQTTMLPAFENALAGAHRWLEQVQDAIDKTAASSLVSS